jgi:hypothetical protein
LILTIIIACEIGFWVFLGAGLASRYLLNLRRLGAALLVCVPLVDLVLLAATVVDLRSGATANFAHGLAAVYLGFSVAFGHSVIRWADVRFAHRFAGGPPPEPKPKYGKARILHEWREFGKALVAWGISCALLAEVFAAWISRLTLILGVWFVFWPLGYTVFPPKPKGSSA